jgi:hypothetical protein
MDTSIIPNTPGAQLATQGAGTARIISPEEREARKLRMEKARAARKPKAEVAVPAPVTVPVAAPTPVAAPRVHVAQSVPLNPAPSTQRVHISMGIAIPPPVQILRPR